MEEGVEVTEADVVLRAKPGPVGEVEVNGPDKGVRYEQAEEGEGGQYVEITGALGLGP